MVDQVNGAVTKDDIQFMEYHLPALIDGTYRMTVEQTLSPVRTKEENSGDKEELPISDHKDIFFSVLGPRYSLSPQEVHAVFPPRESSGHHANVLPHIVLNRSTMPWERRAVLEDYEDKLNKKESERAADDPDPTLAEKTPWLALLLFDESDPPPKPDKLPVAELKGEGSPFSHPGTEIGHIDDDQVTVIRVPLRLLRAIAPTTEELRYLTHVRQWYKNEIHPESQEKEVAVDGVLAVVIGSRLPRQGARSTVHLVSLERRYDENGFHVDGAETDDRLITLVSLHQWQFTCSEETGNFRDALEALDDEPSMLRLPDDILAQHTGGDSGSTEAAQEFVNKGFVPLPHQLRTGDHTVSWYHGPLTTHHPTDGSLKVGLAHSADDLLRYDATYGMFDTSYAAAWELGRLLLLKNRRTSVSLFQWKRAYASQAKDRRNQNQPAHLSVPQSSPAAKARNVAGPPPDVFNWFEDLRLLKQLPFDYLVPDERMLPAESIRFFCVDPDWIDALLDGAFSVGRTSKGEADRDRLHRAEQDMLRRADAESLVSGFLLRSGVVSGWPDLQVDGFNYRIDDINPPQLADANDPTQSAGIRGHHQLCLLRMERLSPNVLICLFAGEVQTVDIHLKPEAIHFGVNPLDHRHTPEQYEGGYFKALRGHSGLEEIEAAMFTNMVDVETLADTLDNKDIAAVRALLLEKDVKLSPEALFDVDDKDPNGNKKGPWRIIDEEGKGKDVRHWTYYFQRNGSSLSVEMSLAVNVPPRHDTNKTVDSEANCGVIDIKQLYDNLENDLKRLAEKHPKPKKSLLSPFTPAAFALEMIEGVPKVRFTLAMS